ncbi:hypothetical protein SCOR_07525 [Sulfidibacter corallicola]|uniref:Aspartate kinase n=1 Tax=Sulfidibacter corallicola TaxID=2818388 RepID=A0A8A4TPM9_SULCO|nr:hypothetical protein [Sulfidibacter corallicola]QTD51387.1 hypothetical protein J3U87_02865 [Sulfidibacter corallicola]
MRKISDAIRELVQENEFLSLGFHHDLLNLSQVARYLLPLIEARCHKEVQESAVLMNLSRLKRELSAVTSKPREHFFIDKVNIHTNLCSFTVNKTRQSHAELNRLYGTIREADGFMTITEGISEITAIIESENLGTAEQLIGEPFKHIHRDLASVGVKFHEKFLEVPGVLYLMLQMVALQGINVIEVSSTATEFIIYIESSTVNLAFESILARFGKKRNGLT